MRSSVGAPALARRRGHADAGLEVDVRVEPGPGRRRLGIAHASARRRELDVDREARRRPRSSSSRDLARLAHVGSARRRARRAARPCRARPPASTGVAQRHASAPTSPCAPRRAPRPRPANTSGSPSSSRSSSRVGHAARWIEPVSPPRPHLFGDERQDGANRRSSVDERDAQRDRGRARRRRRPRRRTRGPSRARRSRRRTPRRTARCVRARARSRTTSNAAVASSTRSASVASIDRSSGSVTARDRRARPASPDDAEHELRRVEDLDRELAADLHLAFVDRGVDPGPPVARPVAQRVGAVLLDQRHRRDDVALRLRHLLAVGVEDPAVDRRVASTAARRARSRARTTVSNSHVRMISGPCGRRSIGNVRSNRSGSSTQPVDDLRRERRRRPRVHHVGVGDEAARLVALVVGEAGGHVGRRVDGQVVLVGQRSGRRSRARRRRRRRYQTGNGTPK